MIGRSGPRPGRSCPLGRGAGRPPYRVLFRARETESKIVLATLATPSPRARGEGGVRGPLRWVQNRGAQNCGEAPSPSLTSFARPLPARRGEVKIPIRSRDARDSLAPRAGRGWGEGASPLGAELRRSELRRGPLTLAHSARSTSPRAAGRGENSKSVLATHPRPSYANTIRKIVPRSMIASRLNRRWDRLSARSCPTNKREAERRQAH